MTHKAKRREKTRQDKTRQDKTRQDKTRQDKTRQDSGSIRLYEIVILFIVSQCIVMQADNQRI